MTMIPRLISLFALAVLASNTFAQAPLGSSTSHTIGNITYATYETPRGQVTASYQKIGNFEYGSYSNGATSTTQQIGMFRYTDYREPRRSQYVPTYRRR